MPTLQWLNREESVHKSNRVPYRLLEYDRGLSYGDTHTENMLIQGDNLDALKALLPYYAGKVKCIFIDPPYNTKSAFEHYEDNLEHSQWLEMMYPRLEILRELLAGNGSIWVTIDDSEAHYMKVIMDEIFGRKNFINAICVQMSHLSGVKMSHADKKIPKIKEYILMFCKQKEYFNLNTVVIPSSWENALNRYTQYIENLEKDIKFWSIKPIKTAAAEQGINIKNSEEYEKFLVKNSNRIIRTARNRSLPKTGIKNMFSRVKSKTGLDKIVFNDEEVLFAADKFAEIDGVLSPYNSIGDIWLDIGINNLHNEGGIDFRNGKKPEKLTRRILQMSSKKGDIILDSFLGSGTTAAVAHKMGRRYIGIEMGEHAKTHCAERLKKVIDGEQGGISKKVVWKGGGGFRFYHLGEVIFDEEGTINANIRFEHLAAHIWFSETHTPFEQRDKSPLIGIHKNIAYYLLYNGILGDKSPQGGNVLTRTVLTSLPRYSGKKVIYGASSRLGEEKLKTENITFKQTPYDIKNR